MMMWYDDGHAAENNINAHQMQFGLRSMRLTNQVHACERNLALQCLAEFSHLAVHNHNG